MTDTSVLQKENEKLKNDLENAIRAINRLEGRLAQLERKLSSTYHLARDNQTKINYVNHVLRRN